MSDGNAESGWWPCVVCVVGFLAVCLDCCVLGLLCCCVLGLCSCGMSRMLDAQHTRHNKGVSKHHSNARKLHCSWVGNHGNLTTAPCAVLRGTMIQRAALLYTVVIVGRDHTVTFVIWFHQHTSPVKGSLISTQSGGMSPWQPVTRTMSTTPARTTQQGCSSPLPLWSRSTSWSYAERRWPRAEALPFSLRDPPAAGTHTCGSPTPFLDTEQPTAMESQSSVKCSPPRRQDTPHMKAKAKQTATTTHTQPTDGE